MNIQQKGDPGHKNYYHTAQLYMAFYKNPEPEMAERLHNLGIPQIIGDATRTDIPERARAKNASKVYPLCPDDTIYFSVAMATQRIKTGRKI